MTRPRVTAFIFLALGLIWMGLHWVNSQAKPAHRLGVHDHRLADCPDRPNCISTQATRPEQRIDPILLKLPADQALRQLESTIQAMPRSRIVASDNRYLRAEFRSPLLGFVDDVEFFVDESEQLIHFRSASRVGYSDLGVNRRRMEQLRRDRGHDK